jgi:uncharacterized protein (DUF433 family)
VIVNDPRRRERPLPPVLKVSRAARYYAHEDNRRDQFPRCYGRNAGIRRDSCVPAQTFIEYLEGDESIDDFLEGFPTVSREQVIQFLEEAKNLMLPEAG